MCDLYKLQDFCVEKVNEYRGGKAFSDGSRREHGDKPPLAIFNSPFLQCHNEKALSDLKHDNDGNGCGHFTSGADCGFGRTAGTENSCCKRRCSNLAECKKTLTGCLDQMWDEGMIVLRTGSEQWTMATGHYWNMLSDTAYVTCGFGWDDQDRVYMTQNFWGQRQVEQEISSGSTCYYGCEERGTRCGRCVGCPRAPNTVAALVLVPLLLVALSATCFIFRVKISEKQSACGGKLPAWLKDARLLAALAFLVAVPLFITSAVRAWSQGSGSADQVGLWRYCDSLGTCTDMSTEFNCGKVMLIVLRILTLSSAFFVFAAGVVFALGAWRGVSAGLYKAATAVLVLCSLLLLSATMLYLGFHNDFLAVDGTFKVGWAWSLSLCLSPVLLLLSLISVAKQADHAGSGTSLSSLTVKL